MEVNQMKQHFDKYGRHLYDINGYSIYIKPLGAILISIILCIGACIFGWYAAKDYVNDREYKIQQEQHYKENINN